MRWVCGNFHHTSCEEAMMSIKALQQIGGPCGFLGLVPKQRVHLF